MAISIFPDTNNPDLDVRDVIVVHNFRFQAGLLATFNYFAWRKELKLTAKSRPAHIVTLPHSWYLPRRTHELYMWTINQPAEEGYRVIGHQAQAWGRHVSIVSLDQIYHLSLENFESFVSGEQLLHQVRYYAAYP